jgi:DNA sulfur modification protein DndC
VQKVGKKTAPAALSEGVSVRFSLDYQTSPSTSVAQAVSYIERIQKDVTEAYLADGKPWIVGFSGGKDSTAVLQIVYYALMNLSPDKRTKPVYVLASDTRVEAPSIVERIDSELDKVESTAKEHGLPITTHKVHPLLNDSFWVNLIGRGYPSPNRWFRWCTDRLKIKPVSRFIREQVSRSGSVVVVLGARCSERRKRDSRTDHGGPPNPGVPLPSSYRFAKGVCLHAD